MGLIFAGACEHVHYALYDRTYFVGLIFIATYLQKTTELNSSKYPALQ